MNIEIFRAFNNNIEDINIIEDSLNKRILSKDAISIDLNNENNYYYIAKFKNEIVGYIGVSYLIDHIDILSIAVIKKYRKNGVASKLLSEVLTLSKKLNVQDIFLEVRKSNNSAISFYEKNGFEKINERKNYYINPIEDAFLYLKKLV